MVSRQLLASVWRSAVRVSSANRTASSVCSLARAGGSPAGVARLLGEVGRGSSRDPGGTVRAMLRRHGLAPRTSAARRTARRR